jgi:3-oxoacyl-[acyl-carrier protein] reductase
MNLGLEDKVILITGASRGIGAATARGFAAEGSRLALVSRGHDDLAHLSDELRSAHRKVEVLTFNRDVTEAGCPDSVTAEVERHFGNIDVLVNNVGAGLRKSFDELDEADWASCLNLNLMAAIRFSRAVLPGMKRRRSGRIVNLGAVSATHPRRGQIASNTAKAALVNFTRSLAGEVAPDNVLVNIVCPGSVAGSRWMERDESARAGLVKAVPLGRVGEPKEVAGLIVFLASDRASYITGTVINVDGGQGIGG